MLIEQQIATFFYVDDDSDDLMFFQDAIDALGKYVKLFDRGDDMINLLRNPPPKPSVVFLDLNMPVKNGFEILKEIRQSEEFRDIPIVIYSTAYNPDVVQKCIDLGANLYITKATSLPGMIKMMKHVLSVEWDHFKPTSLREFVYKP